MATSYAYNTLTQAGVALIAQATAANPIVFVGALSKATAASSSQDLSLKDATWYDGKTGVIGAVSAVAAVARVVAVFRNAGQRQSAQSIAVTARLASQSDSAAVILCAMSDPDSTIELPGEDDTGQGVEFPFNIAVDATDTVTTTPGASASLADLERFVSMYRAGNPTAGEDQTIFGDKAFYGWMRADAQKLSGVRLDSQMASYSWLPSDESNPLKYRLGVANSGATEYPPDNGIMRAQHSWFTYAEFSGQNVDGTECDGYAELHSGGRQGGSYSQCYVGFDESTGVDLKFGAFYPGTGEFEFQDRVKVNEDCIAIGALAQSGGATAEARFRSVSTDTGPEYSLTVARGTTNPHRATDTLYASDAGTSPRAFAERIVSQSTYTASVTQMSAGTTSVVSILASSSDNGGPVSSQTGLSSAEFNAQYTDFEVRGATVNDKAELLITPSTFAAISAVDSSGAQKRAELTFGFSENSGGINIFALYPNTSSSSEVMDIGKASKKVRNIYADGTVSAQAVSADSLSGVLPHPSGPLANDTADVTLELGQILRACWPSGSSAKFGQTYATADTAIRIYDGSTGTNPLASGQTIQILEDITQTHHDGILCMRIA